MTFRRAKKRCRQACLICSKESCPVMGRSKLKALTLRRYLVLQIPAILGLGSAIFAIAAIIDPERIGTWYSESSFTVQMVIIFLVLGLGFLFMKLSDILTKKMTGYK